MNRIKQAFSWITGQQAEQRARAYLEQQGLIFITQNYRCRRGEIDLIMQQNDEYVFVEVKYRKRASHGQAVEHFTVQKRRKVEAAMHYFLQQHQLNASMVAHRIDLLSIDDQHINWLKAI